LDYFILKYVEIVDELLLQLQQRMVKINWKWRIGLKLHYLSQNLCNDVSDCVLRIKSVSWNCKKISERVWWMESNLNLSLSWCSSLNLVQCASHITAKLATGQIKYVLSIYSTYFKSNCSSIF